MELEEAARIDGCSRAGVFLRIALPLVRFGLVSAAILAPIFTWNRFLFPFVLAGVTTKTLPVDSRDVVEKVNFLRRGAFCRGDIGYLGRRLGGLPLKEIALRFPRDPLALSLGIRRA